MEDLNIVATIVVKDSYKDEVISILNKVVDETRKEDGIISYNLYKDLQNPLKFIILEHWKSKEEIDKHNKTKHFQEFLSSIEGKVDGLTVNVIEKIY